MQSIPQPRRTYLFLYLLFGLILAVLLAALASLVALLAAEAALSLDNLIQLHLSDPLFVLIDLFAVGLVIVFGFLGAQKDRTEHARAQLQWLSQKRSNDLQEMKDQMLTQDKKFSDLEAVISRGKQQWVATFDAVKDLIILTDENGVIMRCNRATGEAFQTGFSQIIGRKINELFLGAQAAENVPDHYLADRPEIHFPRLDGWYQVSRNFLIIDGQQNGWVFVFRDISDRKHDMQELQRLNEYYQQLVVNSPIAIVTLTLEERIVDVNPAFKKLFGYEPGEVLGWKLDALIGTATQAGEMRTLTESVRRGETVRQVTQRRGKDGDLVEVEVFGIPVIIGGKQIGSLRLYHDVSGLVASQREALATGPFVEEGWSLADELVRAESVTAVVAGDQDRSDQEAGELAPEELDIIIIDQGSAGETVEQGEQDEQAALDEQAAQDAQATQDEQTPQSELAAQDTQAAPVDIPEEILLAYVQPAGGSESDLPAPEGELSAALEELKRTTVQRSLRIEKIEGIGPVYAQKLAEAGIETTADLLENGKTPQGRQDLSENLGISDVLVLKWVNMADLMRVKGIGEEYSELLEKAGVDTVRELRQRNPVNLHARLGEVNAQHHLVRRLPHRSEVENWIRLANELEPLVTY